MSGGREDGAETQRRGDAQSMEGREGEGVRGRGGERARGGGGEEDDSRNECAMGAISARGSDICAAEGNVNMGKASGLVFAGRRYRGR